MSCYWNLLFWFLFFTGRLPEAAKNLLSAKKCRFLSIFFSFFNIFKYYVRPHFYLVSDSYSRPQTRESVESSKNSLEYESFEYESRLDTPLLCCGLWRHRAKFTSQTKFETLGEKGRKCRSRFITAYFAVFSKITGRGG